MWRNGGQAAWPGDFHSLKWQRTGQELPEPNVNFWGRLFGGLGRNERAARTCSGRSKLTSLGLRSGLEVGRCVDKPGSMRRPRRGGGGDRHLQRLLEELTGKERRGHGEVVLAVDKTQKRLRQGGIDSRSLGWLIPAIERLMTEKNQSNSIS